MSPIPLKAYIISYHNNPHRLFAVISDNNYMLGGEFAITEEDIEEFSLHRGDLVKINFICTDDQFCKVVAKW